ncbi:MAG: CDGSH iron-sulfur domain-containing protein [Porphyromonadaceae bacterium]|nr:CDGSH iron-sulfur domain-containing protein [Porphyromonadaceae bacterium]
MEKELNVQIRKGGPYVVTGSFKLILPDGEEKIMSGKSFFCRCGQSKNKPFCDGFHKNVEFDV